MANMSEIENKFIMMSRIAVLMSRLELTSTVYISDDGGHCSLSVLSGNTVIESLDSWDCTEEELLNWWSIIEG